MSGAGDPGPDLARLYRDAIRRHSSDPVGYRRDIGPTHRHEEYNPQCGDRIEVLFRVQDRTISAAAFEGEACAICMASASLLCSLAAGSTVDELQALGDGLGKALTAPLEGAGGAAVGAAVGAASAATGQRIANPSRLKPLVQPFLQKPPPEPALHPDLQPLLGVRPYPSRVRCATLPWTAAQRALSG